MSDLKVTLGDFVFQGLEIPESIPYGGSQKLVTHELVGGVRVVDAMGRSDMPLVWSGLLLGQEANNRARYLNNLRIAGKVLSLTWHEMSFNVVIQEFTANFQRYYEVPYSIHCVVVEDLTTPIVGFITESVDSLVDGDMTQATSIGGDIGDSVLSTTLGTLNNAIAQVSSFAKATQATINSVLLPLAAVQARVRILIDSVGGVVNNVTTLGGILPNNTIAQNAANILNQVVSMTNLAKLYDLQSVLGRMGGNIGTIGGGGISVSSAGGNLYGMASEYYGDPTAWTTIAKANNLTDPQLTGLQTLSIPFLPDNFGGVLSK
jgi:hypothetical protein